MELINCTIKESKVEDFLSDVYRLGGVIKVPMQFQYLDYVARFNESLQTIAFQLFRAHP